jgi:DNA-binding winged helix-turn-helix (wHTH) protein
LSVYAPIAGALATAAPGGQELCFGDFRLVPAARLLLRRGVPVPLGSRAFDLLHALLQARGAVVSKEEIVRQVWPTTIVDESNLRFQIACLRKALGEQRDLIKTVPGRGYLFVETRGRTIPDEPRSFGDMRGALPGPWVLGAIAPGQPCEDVEVLRGLLRSVLDELWRMSRGGRPDPAAFAGLSGQL